MKYLSIRRKNRCLLFGSLGLLCVIFASAKIIRHIMLMGTFPYQLLFEDINIYATINISPIDNYFEKDSVQN